MLVTDDLQGITPAVLHMTVNPVDDLGIITGDFNATINEDGSANRRLERIRYRGTDRRYLLYRSHQPPLTVQQPSIRNQVTTYAGANYFGTDAFQVLVTDDLQGITPAVLRMTVNPVDDPAIITATSTRPSTKTESQPET